MWAIHNICTYECILKYGDLPGVPTLWKKDIEEVLPMFWRPRTSGANGANVAEVKTSASVNVDQRMGVVQHLQAPTLSESTGFFRSRVFLRRAGG